MRIAQAALLATVSLATLIGCDRSGEHQQFWAMRTSEVPIGSEVVLYAGKSKPHPEYERTSAGLRADVRAWVSESRMRSAVYTRTTWVTDSSGDGSLREDRIVDSGDGSSAESVPVNLRRTAGVGRQDYARPEVGVDVRWYVVKKDGYTPDMTIEQAIAATQMGANGKQLTGGAQPVGDKFVVEIVGDDFESIQAIVKDSGEQLELLISGSSSSPGVRSVVNKMPRTINDVLGVSAASNGVGR